MILEDLTGVRIGRVGDGIGFPADEGNPLPVVRPHGLQGQVLPAVGAKRVGSQGPLEEVAIAIAVGITVVLIEDLGGLH